MAQYHEKLGRAIQALRLAAKLTQDELSDKAGLSYSTLAKIERGAIKNPSVFTVASIAKVLGVTIEELLGHTEATTAMGSVAESPVQMVFSDINGVLVRFFQRAFVEVAEEYSIPVDRIETTFWHYNDAGNRGELTIEEFDKAVGQQLGIEHFKWQERYLRAVEPIMPMHDCLQEIITTLPVGLLSNILPGFIDALLEKGLIPNLDYRCIVDSSVVGAIKPETNIYRAAEEQSGFSGSQILFVDDSRTNLMAAERLGWRVLWFDDYRPDESVKRVREALKAV